MGHSATVLLATVVSLGHSATVLLATVVSLGHSATVLLATVVGLGHSATVLLATVVSLGHSATVLLATVVSLGHSATVLLATVQLTPAFPKVLLRDPSSSCVFCESTFVSLFCKAHGKGPKHKRFERTLIYYDTDTPYAKKGFAQKIGT